MKHITNKFEWIGIFRKAILLIASVVIICSPGLGFACDTDSRTIESSKVTGKSLLNGVPVGYTVLKTGDGVNFALWYPASSKPKSYRYMIGENPVTTSLAIAGDIKSGAFPVIFYAHGASGCGLSSFFLTEALARKGYVVVAPDFSDQIFASRINETVPQSKKKTRAIWKYIYSLRDRGLDSSAEQGRETFKYRPLELISTIEYIKTLNKDKNSKFYKHLNMKEIGLIGHSFGAWTALLIAGASARFHKKEVKAVVALSGPVNKHVFAVESDNDLKKITCPVMFQYGDSEKLFPDRQDYDLLYKKANRPKFIAAIESCNHFNFSCGSGKQFSIADDYISHSIQRSTITRLSLKFFDKYLKKKKTADILKSKSRGVSFFESQL